MNFEFGDRYQLTWKLRLIRFLCHPCFPFYELSGFVTNCYSFSFQTNVLGKVIWIVVRCRLLSWRGLQGQWAISGLKYRLSDENNIRDGCVIAIFVIKIMAALLSSRLMIKVNVTKIRDIWTQNCVLTVQTKMSTHRGYLQLVLGTEWNFGTQPCLALCSREYKSPVLKCQTILSAIGVRSEMGP